MAPSEVYIADEKSSIDSSTSPEVVHHVDDDTPSLTSRTSSTYSYFDPNLPYYSDEQEEDSPYPEVRSAVSSWDDPEMPASTLRAWVLGMIFAVLIPGVNQFFYFRYPSVSITGLVAQLIVFPFGLAWARWVPRWRLWGISLNDGPFTIKEHVLVTVMAGVGAMSAYSTGIVAVQRVYYNTRHPFLYQWLLVMSTQLIGFSIGGITRRFLVTPASMIWPNTLVQCAMFNTLHSPAPESNVSSPSTLLSHLTTPFRSLGARARMFLIVSTSAAIYYFLPGFLFQALSIFSWVCWIAPNSLRINQMFGYRSGLGFSVLTFDWNQIAYIGSPLATPWWAEANVAAGFVLFYWVLTPVLYYRNVWWSQYLPISSSYAYDNTGAVYNHTRILNEAGDGIDLDKYHAYSPVYLSMSFAISYGLSFLSIAATIPHAILYFYKPIRNSIKACWGENAQQKDIHARLMEEYKPIPEIHYFIVFALTFTAACCCISLWPGGMTIWALVVALLISIVYVVPIGMIQAVTNRQVGLNVITELIVGFMIPGRPTAMMIFKTYGYITMSQAMQFTADLKLGHYMKIPPRPMFWCQVVSTVIAGTVQLGVQAWMFEHIPDICDTYQKDNFTCQSTHVFATASVIWGLVGPGLQFAKGQVYYALLFFFIIGFLCPIILWGITYRFPRTASRLNYINFPLVFSGLDAIPPATALNYIPWVLTGFIFQFLIRRRKFGWWRRYNYVISAALDAGTGVGVLIVFFAVQYPRGGYSVASGLTKASGVASGVRGWWGNRVYKETADWRMEPLRQLAAGEVFGPDTAWR